MNGFEAKPLFVNGSAASHHSHGPEALAAPLKRYKPAKPSAYLLASKETGSVKNEGANEAWLPNCEALRSTSLAPLTSTTNNGG